MVETKVKASKTVVVTHDGSFHADEILAIALLKAFEIIDDFEVIRTRDPKEISRADIVIDVGRIYNPRKMRFDHHQMDPRKKESAASLVWKYIMEKKGIAPDTLEWDFAWKNLDNLVKEVSEHDNGFHQKTSGHFSFLIAGFNSNSPYSEEQEIQFRKALEFAIQVVENYIRRAEDTRRQLKIWSESVEIPALKLIVFKEYIQIWKLLIDPVDHWFVMWYEKAEGYWKVQKAHKNAPNLPKDPKAVFVHETGFFAVFESDKDALEYLYKIINK